MEPDIAINLIEKGIDKKIQPQTWADLGAGHGTFTTALSTLLSPGSTIYAVDKDDTAVRNISNLPKIHLHKVVQDFTKREFKIPGLDGVIFANSLHFVKAKEPILIQWKETLNSGGRIIVIEYDMITPNPYVPYPINYQTLQKIVKNLGMSGVEKIGEHPSLYNRVNIYSAFISLDTNQIVSVAPVKVTGNRLL